MSSRNEHLGNSYNVCSFSRYRYSGVVVEEMKKLTDQKIEKIARKHYLDRLRDFQWITILAFGKAVAEAEAKEQIVK